MSSKYKYGRHTPALLLLFLAQEPAYGSLLLNKIRQLSPSQISIDSAAIYRSLKELEKMGAVQPYWDFSEPGPAKKWYKLTRTGYAKLAEFKENIENRKKILDFFLNTYASLPHPTE